PGSKEMWLAKQTHRQHGQGEEHQNQDTKRAAQSEWIEKVARSQAKIEVDMKVGKVSKHCRIIRRNACCRGQKHEGWPGQADGRGPEPQPALLGRGVERRGPTQEKKEIRGQPDGRAVSHALPGPQAPQQPGRAAQAETPFLETVDWSGPHGTE